MKEKYTLDFVIPQGPTGPQGKSGGLSAYGGRFNDQNTSINLSQNVRTRVPLEESFFKKNVDYNKDDAATALIEGVYEIQYVVNVSTFVDTFIYIAISVDSVDFAYSSKSLKAGESYIFHGLCLKDISANEVVELIIVSSEDGEVTIDQDSCFTIKCLD